MTGTQNRSAEQLGGNGLDNRARLRALDAYGVRDLPADAGFDTVVSLAAQICGTPTALVTFVDEARQHFRGRFGFAAETAPLEVGFCPLVVELKRPLVICDAAADARYRDNSAVRDGGVRFYVGVPLLTSDGEALGTVCVTDREPQPEGLTDPQVAGLEGLASQVVTQLELRRAVAERDAALERRRSDEARNRQVLDSAVDFAIVVTDLAGRVVDWNRGAENVLRWTKTEMLGTSAERFFTPEDREADRIAVEMRRSVRDGRAADERWHLKKDGQRFWSSGEMMPLRDEAGEHTGFVKIVRDRTEQHLAGERLRDLERQLVQAQEAGGVGLCTVDVASGMLAGTPGFSKLYGLPHREVRSADDFDVLVVPEDRHLVSSTEETPTDLVYRIRRADTGEIRWIERKGDYQRGEDGQLVRFVGVARDVTDQRTARDDLARSEERYRALFEGIDDGFCIIEFFDGPHGPLSDYVHVEANPGYEQQTGIANIVGRTLRDLAPSEADGWAELYGGVLRTGEPIRFERDFVAAGRVIEVSAARLEPASRRQVSVLFRDITGRRQAEARLRESEERLRFALDAGRLGSWSLDLATLELTTSTLCRTNFGRPADEPFTYAELRDTIHPDDRERMASAVRSSIETKGNYDIEYRIVLPDGETRWIEVRGQPSYAPDGTPVRMDGVTLDVTERRTGEEHMRLMVNELNHRVKNTLAAVQSIAAQTFRDPDRFEASRTDFSARLVALARAHDLLTESSWAGATLRDVVARVVDPHRGDDGRRFQLAGPHVSLDPKSALALSMAIHELCTNAAKYGALSTSSGQVDVVWTVPQGDDGKRLHLTWRETGGPPVEEPQRRGFGSRLVERALAAELGGEVKIAYEPSGVVCTIDAPLHAEPGGT